MPVSHQNRKTPVTLLAVSIGLALQMSAVAHAQDAAQTTGSGQATPAEGTVDTLDTVSEAKAGIDFNQDGDFNDLIVESAVATPTGFINVDTNNLPASEFQIRALRDIYIDLEEPAPAVVRDWTLSGYVGGLAGFDPAQNVTIRVEGALSVKGGIVSASATGGELSLRAASISCS